MVCELVPVHARKSRVSLLDGLRRPHRDGSTWPQPPSVLIFFYRSSARTQSTGRSSTLACEPVFEGTTTLSLRADHS